MLLLLCFYKTFELVILLYFLIIWTYFNDLVVRTAILIFLKSSVQTILFWFEGQVIRKIGGSMPSTAQCPGSRCPRLTNLCDQEW